MMKRLFHIMIFITILMMVIPDFFIVWHYIQPHGALWMALFGVILLWEAGVVVVMCTWWIGAVRSIRLFFTTILLLVFPKLLFAITAPLLGWQLTLVLVAMVILAFAYGFVFGWLRLKVRRIDYVSADVPEAFDGYRIMQVSDLHLGTFAHQQRHIRKVVDTAMAEQCDMMVFTGDLMNESAQEIMPHIETLARLEAPDGVFSVTGNHDYVGGEVQRVRDLQRQMGWHLLDNEHVVIHRKGDALALVGVENTVDGAFLPQGDLTKALEGVPGTAFKILLSHDPAYWRRVVLVNSDIQLTLSGHTHGGQLKLGKLSPAGLIYHEWGGAYRSGGRMLLVSLGVGGNVPFRLGAWPEINVITLRRDK